ncbi:MAG TPA: ribonuclease HII [Thermoleophilia bacterium]|nr:ribonuclease HII [Thermoleophilia bacterium]
MVAAVSLDYRRPLAGVLRGLTDSKVLSREARESLYPRILVAASEVVIVAVSPVTIDRVGLHRCNLEALKTALYRLDNHYDIAFVDGFALDDERLRATQLIRGDAKSASVAAASVIAKVTRDRLMARLNETYPGYGFLQHVGYGTQAHRAALRELGPCEIHRHSFAGVGFPQLALFSGTPISD